MARKTKMARKRRPAPITTTPTGWHFLYGRNEPVFDVNTTSFVWTSNPYQEIDYMLHPWGKLLPAQSVSITYKLEPVSGTPEVHSTECSTGQNPAGKAALIITCGTNSTYYDRAWWIQTAPMTIGTHTITAPLGNGNGWTFVAADSSPTKYPDKWNYMLENIKKIGLTFNGCSSMGHGAFVVNGTMKMTIVSVVVS